MMTAAEYREAEIRRRILTLFGATNPKDRAYWEAQLPAYTEPDYMDFAERYADFVCDYEKAHTRKTPTVPAEPGARIGNVEVVQK